MAVKLGRFIICLFLWVFISLQANDQPFQSKDNPIPLFEELNYCAHPVKTSNPKAQAYFNQGLTFIYAFNHDAAYRSFAEAIKLDPQLAMGYWGLALSLGPIMSYEMPLADHKKAYEMMQQALQLAPYASKCDQAYINVLAKRYSNDPNPDFKQQAIEYKNALRELIKQFPDDADAAALFGISVLDCNSGDAWHDNGKPMTGTLEAVDILENGLKKDSSHIGLNHYYIHMMEGSKHPERALVSANRFNGISPILTHLVHTPCHIYLPAGEYHKAILVNEKAVAACKQYKDVLGKRGVKSISHNLLYLIRSYAMAGRFNQALSAAQELKNLPGSDAEVKTNMAIPLFVLMRFGAWQEILNQPSPPDQPLSQALWHMARSFAFASLNEINFAENEQALFKKFQEQINQEDEKKVLEFFDFFLNARRLEKMGDIPAAIKSLQQAVAIQDQLGGDSAFDFEWLIISRENLGGLLLRNQHYPEAETVFREDLNLHPGNGRSLFGLWNSLEEQGQQADAFWVKRALDRAWQDSNSSLNITLL